MFWLKLRREANRATPPAHMGCAARAARETDVVRLDIGGFWGLPEVFASSTRFRDVERFGYKAFVLDIEVYYFSGNICLAAPCYKVID